MGRGNYLHRAEHYSEQFMINFDWNDEVDFDGYDQAGFNEECFKDEVIHCVANALPKRFTKWHECHKDFLERFHNQRGAWFIAESKTVEVFGLWYENQFIIVCNVLESTDNRVLHIAEKSVTKTNMDIQKHLLKNTCFSLSVRTSAWTSGAVRLEDFK